MKPRNHEVEISPWSHFCFFKVFVAEIMQFSIPQSFLSEILMRDCGVINSLLLSHDL